MLVSFLKKNWIIFSLVALFILLRLPSLFEPYWYGDEGIYLTIGQALNRGYVLYRQIHDNKPPTLYYFAAISQTVFGFRLLLSLWMIPTIYCFYLLAKKVLKSRLSFLATLIFLILTSIPLFEGNIANAEIFMLLPTILAVYLFFLPITNYRLLIAGLLLGFAFTIKIPVFIETIFLALWLFLIISRFDIKRINLFSSLGKITLLFLSFIIPIFIFLLYFASKNALNEFLFSALFQNFGYLSSWSSGTHSGSAAGGGLINRGLVLIIFWIFTFVLLIKKKITKELSFICFWFSATIFGALLSTRPYPHYLIQVLPPLSLLVAYIFMPSNTKKIKYFIIGLLVVLTFLFVKYKFYVYPVISYYWNYYSHISNLNSLEYRQYFGSSVNNTYLISEFVDKNTNYQDKIFVWGDEPYIYALSRRLPASKYTVSYHVADFNQYQFVFDQLTINLPKLIIYYPQPNRPFALLDKFINRYYYPIKSFGSVLIYQLL